MILQDYEGATYFLEAHADKELVVFVVDDNKVYLNLLKNLIKSKKITVHAFTSGEECIRCLELEPDLIILDYHLDGVNPKAKKGDIIAEMIHEELPSAEIVIISSDQKFKLLTQLKTAFTHNIVYKDRNAPEVLRNKVEQLNTAKQETIEFKKSLIWFIALSILVVILMILIWRLIA
jgi:CheY-like chemotaxis protein